MATPNTKRMYGGVFIGFGIRGQIGLDQIFRVRRGNGHYGSVDGEIYQDKFAYFVPSSINNVQSDPYRAQWKAAVLHWQYKLTDEEKAAYQRRASHGLRMSGYNLFMREAMKGLVEMFVDRGDPAAYDYAKEDLSLDGAWHDLDLSSIVPAGAKAILLCGHVQGNGADWTVIFRENGNSNEVNHCSMETLRANVTRHRSMIVALDPNRVIEYNADNQAWDALDLIVRGWWT